ncbi:MAG: vanadium-dependent haloperoxidase, partial [Candidatus Nanopelagicales bacterium]
MNSTTTTDSRNRRLCLALLCIPLVLLCILSAPSRATASRVSPDSDAQMVVDWQRIAMRTIYTDGLNPPPVGALYLGFTALAVNDAVHASLKRGNTDVEAAVAVAAHDVLREYFPASADNLSAALTASLSGIPDGAQKNKGIRVGHQAAEDMIASRVGDGRNDTSVIYSVPSPVPVGVWAPPATGMLAPWLGFVDPLVVSGPVAVDGPDALGSADYAADYNEVRLVGSAGSTTRTQSQTEIALFFTANPVAQLHLALCSYLEANPIGIERTATLFATSEAAVADSAIQAWRAKYDYRFWRPFQAIQRGDEDGNPDTVADPAWKSLVDPNPPYADYFSGHGSVVSSFAG